MDSLRFARQFLKHPRQLGTLVQSGRTLARKMAQEIGQSVQVVEFGSGTGPVTREILSRLPGNGRLTCFEINPEFCRCLRRIGDPRLRVINDDASQCARYVGRADCVISGLPLTLFDSHARERILAIAGRSGLYVQLQYTPILGQDIRRYFSSVTLKFVAMNFPPAFVYVCRGMGQVCAVASPRRPFKSRLRGSRVLMDSDEARS
ncbi:MAG TPA: methyltransferase domain-containing protein [Sedimentisphaerales bacterium]|nr:methyltransferase domain-containing protein [Sedimentisphaerales bacterium]